MHIWMIYDTVALLLILGLLWVGYRRGFVASILKLVATVAALVASFLLCRPAAAMVYDRFLRERLVAYVDETLLQNSLAAGFGDNIADMLESFTQQGGELLAPIGQMFEHLPGAFGGALEQADAEKTLALLVDGGATLAEALTAAALQPTILLILQSVLFLVFFGLFTLVMGILINISGVFNHIPLIGVFNRVGGALLGGLEAVVLLYILGMAATLAIAALGESPWLSVGILEETRLLSRVIFFSF